MKILVVQETDWIKKGPLQQHHLMERLQKRGHAIRVIDFEVLWREGRGIFSGRKIFYTSKTLSGVNIPVIRPAFLRLPLLVYFSIMLTHTIEVIRQVKEFKPDVIIGFDIPNSYFAFNLAKFFKISSVYYIIDINYLFVPEKVLKPVAEAIELQTVKISDCIIAINDKLRDFYIRNMRANPSKTHVIRAGIDTRRFNPYVSGFRVREKYGIKSGDTVLFFMGWLYNFSGLKEVAYSLMDCKAKPDIKLLVVGKGDLYRELLKLKIDGLDDKLILVDWQPYEKIPEFIAASDICLLPAYNNEVMRYIVPIKMYEYMACGKPVIATRLPGIAKEFGEGNGVIYVERPEEVLNKALEISKDKQKLKELGMKAAEYVRKYSWEAITDQFEELLEDLVNNRTSCKIDRSGLK
jgi:glycosyltransferase involved in cell wall biosynthesis